MKIPLWLFIISCIIMLIFLIIIIVKIAQYKHNNTQNFVTLNKLNNLKTIKNNDGKSISLQCEPITGKKRVYVSASMFNLEDVIYGIGIAGLQEGYNYQAMDFPDMICNLSSSQLLELKNLCSLWNVPWYGICGEIDKLGWEAYCPIRDGMVMGPTLAAISSMTIDDITKDEDSNSMFNKNNLINILKISGNKNPSDQDIVNYVNYKLSFALSVSIGANDLFAMYSSCNTCVFNYNGIQGDAGALAEIGSLGARGIPISIIKGQITADFSGANNPMPTMAASSTNLVLPCIVNTNVGVFNNIPGALTHLKQKVDLMLKNKNNLMAYANYNHDTPLPPLQLFWSSIGALAYFLKHKSKSIPTRGNGQLDFNKDYTDFWIDNIINGKGLTGFLTFAKKCASNLESLRKDSKWQDVIKFWS